MSTPSDRKLAAALRAFKRSWNRGESQNIAEFCSRHPECGPELRAAIEAFIAESQAAELDSDADTDADAGAGIDEPTQIFPLTPMGDLVRQDPTWIGPYRVLGPLGEGGMGTVYLAEQTEPVKREVAIKLVRLGMDSTSVLRRFERERQALALMSHPTIAKVYDAGVTETGQPYFVMEVVEGIPLTEFCDLYKLSTRQRIQVFQQICAGVEHAHKKSLLHRDLKPANILVSLSAGQIVVKIIDFGLARATESGNLARTAHTQEGRVVGTPEYMSPEQARGETRTLDTRSDIYTLGVVLYQLLTGELPYRRRGLERRGPIEMLHTIIEEIPERPSSRITSIGKRASVHARNRRSSRSNLRKALQGELDWIVMKALAKDPNRRYQSVIDLSNDLSAYLQDEPVGAGPESSAYRLSRLRRLTRRYRVQLVNSVAVVGISAFCALSVWSFVDARSLAKSELSWKDHAAEQQRIAQEQTRLADTALQQTRALVAELGIAGALADSEARRRELLQTWPPDLDALREHIAKLDQWRLELGRLRLGHPNSLVGSSFQRLDQRLAAARRATQGRLLWAEAIHGLTVGNPSARASWQRARQAILTADGTAASRLYAADPIDLAPQLGLLPIRRDPHTGLWEFYHLRSAWDPRLNFDPAAIRVPLGGRDIDERDGIVFVLIPGDGRGNRPFFLAQHELTQGQWLRLSGGRNPSTFPPGCIPHPGDEPIDLRHPVESVTFRECEDLLERHGLRLPGTGEWQYAAAARTGPGFDPASFRRSPWFETIAHARAGSSPPNGFGLHEMVDNVSEWCSDEVAFGSVLHRAVRGGNFHAPHLAIRARLSAPVGSRSSTRGLRAARAIMR